MLCKGLVQVGKAGGGKEGREGKKKREEIGRGREEGERECNFLKVAKCRPAGDLLPGVYKVLVLSLSTSKINRFPHFHSVHRSARAP